jgi:Type III restriction enzyme, res subunit
MARHTLSEPRVQLLVDSLTSLTLELGSVNAVAELLSGEDEDSQIYPNRLHGLLTGDPARSVNTATLEAIEGRLAATATHPRDRQREAEERGRITQSVAAEALAGATYDDVLVRVAERLGYPLGVIQHVVGGTAARVPMPTTARNHSTPDWSWQETAVDRCVRALRKSPRHKAGLVIPTGGGKTRIALTVALRWLSAQASSSDLVLWVTHRHHLRTQARRVLQKLLSENSNLPEGASELFTARIQFAMVQDLETAIAEFGSNTSLVIVDEAHHAAAPSYAPIFNEMAVPVLSLTATPNRRDELPIGIDEICYTITYRELIDRGCLVEPSFEPPLDFPNLSWYQPGGLDDLADYLLDRAESDFTKTLVVVALQSRAESLHQALLDLLAARQGHVLTIDNIGYVHGLGTSGPGSPSDFLDEMLAWPRGIVVATGQLIGEGFDDPGIDSVVVTYPSTSIGHLMQVAGRAMRMSPGKTKANIVQVRESPLDYHFEQRWIYQDISDELRPSLVDYTYGNAAELQLSVRRLLIAHRVNEVVTARIISELSTLAAGEKVNIMLSGLPYWEGREAFDAKANWGGVAVTESNRAAFLGIFNAISYRTDDLKEAESFLKTTIRRETFPGSTWRSYIDLIYAMEYARREIHGAEYAGASNRDYIKPVGTTWLRYATFTYAPMVPAELDAFLSDTINRSGLIAQYQEDSERWNAALKVQLPLAGAMAYLFDTDQMQWFVTKRTEFARALAELEPDATMEALDRLCASLVSSPIPLRVLKEFRQFLRVELYETQVMILATPDSPTRTIVAEVSA